VQIVLGVTQQLALVPVFLHYCSSDMLAAWLAAYAAGNLVLVADAGLTSRVINRFLALKSCGEGRTAQFFASMQQIYIVLVALLVAAIVIGTLLVPPSQVFGFQAIGDFNASFAIMVAGMLVALPSNLASGLYRAHGRYGRVVWLQCATILVSQLAQVAAIVLTGRLAVIAMAFVVPQIIGAAYLAVIDVRRLFPFLARERRATRSSWRWIAGQFGKAFPFAVAGTTELVLQNLPVLMISAIVIDRIEVAQWGLTRTVAGLVRALCLQATLPIAAELGHDRAIGATDPLRRLYARGSVMVALLASVVVSGLLAFWQDFFALWTHDAIPYDLPLTLTLLLGGVAVAPAVLALSYGYYSDRGTLLARTKGLQLAAFVVLSLVLTPWIGPLGMAIAVVATDVVIQFGFLARAIIWETLQRPGRHVAFQGALMVVVTAFGWGLGVAIRTAVPGSGFAHFVTECLIWLLVMAAVASPLSRKWVRDRLADAIPN
jgi:O-antigen/teichoic acid export membrane protein